MTQDPIEKKVDESWKEKSKDLPKNEETPESHAMPPADFKFFLSTLAMQAWIGLGVMPNPLTQKADENLEQAKFIIDILGVLKEKTKGNLSKEEGELLEQLLYELHLSYVHKTTGKP